MAQYEGQNNSWNAEGPILRFGKDIGILIADNRITTNIASG
jgi:hypothetical protein